VAPQRPSDELLRGMLDMLVLKALQLGPMHGWGITERLEQGSLARAVELILAME
jgi:DNA-binding PadR family transcriptional regulator